MTRRYVTRQGDVVDAICKREYGTEVATTERVYDANPGLAAVGAALDEGISIVLPDLPAPKARVIKTINLWDKR